MRAKPKIYLSGSIEFSKSHRAWRNKFYKALHRDYKVIIPEKANCPFEKYDPEFDFCINVMPAFEYAATVKTFFNERPDRVTSNTEIPFSTFEATEKMLREFVPDNVWIRHSKSGLWSERKKVHILFGYGGIKQHREK
jgi:hypothetical protein